MVDSFNDEYLRWGEGHYSDAATFLADDTTLLSSFSVQPPGEYEWSPRTDNRIDKGEPTLSLDGFTDRVGNDVISEWFFPGRTPRQIDWLLTNRFNGDNDSELATVGVYDQSRGVWDVYTCVATWNTDNPINNRYVDLTVTWNEAEALA